MLIEKPKAFISPEFLIRQASQTWEKLGSDQLRQKTFVVEQGIFEKHDRDQVDEIMMPIVAISTVASEPYEVVGTVRIHQPEKGIWWGSRLSVTKEYRRVGRLGPELIRFAVGTALSHGCRLFLAHVQLRNVPLFKKLNWEELETIELHGQTHVRMKANLSAFGVVSNPLRGWVTKTRKRAA